MASGRVVPSRALDSRLGNRYWCILYSEWSSRYAVDMSPLVPDNRINVNYVFIQVTPFVRSRVLCTDKNKRYAGIYSYVEGKYSALFWCGELAGAIYCDNAYHSPHDDTHVWGFRYMCADWSQPGGNTPNQSANLLCISNACRPVYTSYLSLNVELLV